MLIAISQRNDKNKYGDLVDNLENNYIDYFEKFGIRLLPIPNSTKEVTYYLENFPVKGIILTGGNDINPNLYGENIKEGLAVSKERDEIEKKLMEVAVKERLPVLGICRGVQFINVYFGGKLINIKEVVGEKIKHVASYHTVTISDEANGIFGNKMETNSYHNYGITLKTLAHKLKVFAKTSDGIVEGLYHPELPIAGIEWHPERKSPNQKENDKLVKAFIKRELFWK